MPFIYTTHYNLSKPTTGEVNWDNEINTNFDVIDNLLYQLSLHTQDTDNPHQTTYEQVGAAPAQHTHSGADIHGQVAQASNSDTVDYIHFRVFNDQLEYSTNGLSYQTIFAGNADTVDNIHFRVSGNLLEFSTDGTNFTIAGEMTKAVYDANDNGIVDDAEKVGGYLPSTSSSPNTVAVRDSSGDLSTRVLKATAPSGTAPLTVSSTTLVTNLNADMVDGKHASSFTSLTTQSTTIPASTAKWLRIATSAVNITRNSGIFLVDWTVGGRHGVVMFVAGCHYGETAGTNLIALHCSKYGSVGVSQARIVYHTTYSNNYAYVEVYVNNSSSSSSMSVGIKLVEPLGWTLVTPIDGSIPSGYTSKTISFTPGAVTGEQLVSTVSTGTAPLVVSSTTTVTNLSSDMVDGYHGGDLVLKNNTSSLSINVPSGSTINFQTGGTTRAYVNDYGLVGAVYNADFAEGFLYGLPEPPEQGTALSVGSDGALYPCRRHQPCVGIVSYRPGILLGMTHNYAEEFQKHRKVPVALTGKVKAKIKTGILGVTPGTPLTTGTNGYLKRRTLFGPIVAIALESLPPRSQGEILVLIK